MTSRERFRAALNHRESDRVPIDTGQDLHNGIHEVAYRNLLEYLDLDDEIVQYDLMQHLVKVREDVLERLHVDTRYIFCNPPSGYKFKRKLDGSWMDEWGIVRKSCGYYDESIGHPLEGIDSVKLDRYRILISSIKVKHDVKVALHSCGSVVWALEDLIEAGFDVLHPLQEGAEENLDAREIKTRYGDRLTFYSNLRNQSDPPRNTGGGEGRCSE